MNLVFILLPHFFLRKKSFTAEKDSLESGNNSDSVFKFYAIFLLRSNEDFLTEKKIAIPNCPITWCNCHIAERKIRPTWRLLFICRGSSLHHLVYLSVPWRTSTGRVITSVSLPEHSVAYSHREGIASAPRSQLTWAFHGVLPWRRVIAPAPWSRRTRPGRPCWRRAEVAGGTRNVL